MATCDALVSHANRRVEFPMKIPIPPKWIILFWCMLGLLLAGGVAQAQDLPYDEEEAQSIDRMLLCPVCPAESIDQAQVPIARQMRGIVREMLAQGASRDEILDFFEDRYGTEVLAAPPKSGINVLAWVIPVAGVFAALLATLAIIRSMVTRRGDEIATGPPSQEGLEPYLEAIDRDLENSGRHTESSFQPGESDPDADSVEHRLEDGLAQNG